MALAAGAFLAAPPSRRATWAREAEARERSLRQARDQQAATAEILGAMAASPPDLQRVLDTIARNAARVCDGLRRAVFRFDGTEIHWRRTMAFSREDSEPSSQRYPAGRTMRRL